MSCADDSLSPIITFDQAIKGAYVRLLELKVGEFDLADYDGSAYSYTAEFVDEAQGDRVSSYDIYVRFDDNTPDNGDNSKEEQLWNSFGQGDFFENERGYKAIDVDILLTQVAGLLGLAEADLSPGDFFEFRSEVILDNGAVFTRANSSSAVNGSAFQGFFDFTAKVTCPISDDLFVGSYKITYDEYDPSDGFDFAFGADPAPVVIRTVSGSSTLREFDFSYLPDSYNFDGQTLRFDIVCDNVQPSNVDTGVGCGGGSIIISAASNPPVDITDDSQFTMDLIDYFADGGCGVPQIPMKVTFTKQ